MKDYSIQSVLDWLETKGLLKKPKHAASFLLCDINQYHPPAILVFLTGLGALLGGAFFCQFLIYADIISPHRTYQLFIVSFISMLFGAMLLSFSKHSKDLQQVFYEQFSFVLILLGKILFVMGIVSLKQYNFMPYPQDVLAFIGLLVITLPTYFIFPVFFDRFIFSFATMISLGEILIFHDSTHVGFFIFYLTLIVLMMVMTFAKHQSIYWKPLLYAVFATLALSIIYLILHLKPEDAIPLKVYDVSMGLALISICLNLSWEKYLGLKVPVLIASFGILLLAIITNAGILFSILLLVLGYAKHENKLTIFGGLFLIAFLILFYYAMTLTLEYKAAVLVGSGIILLIAKLFMNKLEWDRES